MLNICRFNLHDKWQIMINLIPCIHYTGGDSVKTPDIFHDLSSFVWRLGKMLCEFSCSSARWLMSGWWRRMTYQYTYKYIHVHIFPVKLTRSMFKMSIGNNTSRFLVETDLPCGVWHRHFVVYIYMYILTSKIKRLLMFWCTLKQN